MRNKDNKNNQVDQVSFHCPSFISFDKNFFLEFNNLKMFKDSIEPITVFLLRFKIVIF